MNTPGRPSLFQSSVITCAAPGNAFGSPESLPVAVEIEIAEIAVYAEAGPARLHHDQVQVSGEIEVGQQPGARLEPLEPRRAGRIADPAVLVELEHARILLAEHDHVVEAVVVQVSGQGDAVAGPGGHAQRPAERREMAAAVVEQEKFAALFLGENARAPVVIIIDDGERTAAIGRQRAKRRGGLLRETDRNSVRIRLAQDERRQRPGVLAAFQRGHGDDRAGQMGLDFSVLLQFALGVAGSTGLPVKPAQLVMCRRMVGHGPGHVLEIADRVGDLPEFLLRHARLEIERRHRGGDLPRLLECLRGRFRPVLPEQRAAQQVIRRRAVGLELERLPAHPLRVVRPTGQQIGVGQVEPDIGALGRQPERPGVDVDRDNRIALFQQAVAAIHQPRKPGGRRLANQKGACGNRDRQECTADPDQALGHTPLVNERNTILQLSLVGRFCV